MTEFAIAAFFYVGTVGIMAALLYFQAERDAKARAGMDERSQAERQEWAEERQLLLERIQRPEYQPSVPSSVPIEPYEPFDDELHLAGTINTPNPPPDEPA